MMTHDLNPSLTLVNPLRLFEKDARVLRALSHPTRLEILHLLDNQELPVSAIYEMLSLPQANSSQHLKIMRDMGILTCIKKGRERVYRVTDRRYLQIAYAIRLLSDGQTTHNHANLKEFPTQLPISLHDLVPLAQDPVCGMKVSTRLSTFSTTFQGESYFFCASGCLQRFINSPKSYVHVSAVNAKA